MSKDLVVNPRILTHLKQQCGDDQVMWLLLRDLIYEVVNQEQRGWKDHFKKKIYEASSKVGDNNAN